MGGENLLEKAEEQEHLLEASAKELEARIQRENELRSQLEEKEVYHFLFTFIKKNNLPAKNLVNLEIYE